MWRRSAPWAISRGTTVSAKSSSQQATENVQVVAERTEELTASVTEISQQVGQSSGLSFYFPSSRSQMNRDIATYERLSFSKTTGWADFLRQVGAPSRRLNVRRFNSYVIALQAAQDGQGLALGWLSLVKPLLARRGLVQVTDAVIVPPHAFYVTWIAGKPLSREAAILRDWLLAQHP